AAALRRLRTAPEGGSRRARGAGGRGPAGRREGAGRPGGDGLLGAGLLPRRAQVRVQRLDEPVAGRERVDRGRRRDLALREHVMVADERIPRRVEAARLEWLPRLLRPPGGRPPVVVGAARERS